MITPSPQNPRVAVLMPPGESRDLLWSPQARTTAAAMGCRIEMLRSSATHDPAQLALRCAQLLRRADAAITGWSSPRLTEALLREASRLRIVAHAAGSVRGIVSPALFERGIHITSANHLLAQSVAEWSLMMTLIAVRRLDGYAQLGQAGGTMRWERRFEALAMREQVVGIWGFGDVARHLVALLAPLRPRRLLVCDIHPVQTPGVEQVPAQTLFEQADVLHLLAGLTTHTKHRIDAEMLGRMKRGAVLINAGRGELVDPEALRDALSEGRIRAILDVFHHEPLPADDPLRGLSGTILTPHNAGAGQQHLLAVEALREIQRFFCGAALEHEVSPQRAAMMTDPQLKDHQSVVS